MLLPPAHIAYEIILLSAPCTILSLATVLSPYLSFIHSLLSAF
jgi:hypothetical protein